ncbi:HAMP domain-containing sensor histidine kinase [Aneurinibacillus thermoaerophilus]|uniref:HAMP domain-containing sensor histidine kinase n=1 Tax=Aneurinibacillus thermoaerophilus TaxID=143495 RepID=UPI002E212D13|nr:HAMP domain-containing sensor histidine kinase [Aneurinibacillus thermoaerophilus]MED0762951.1 HAMP domain-containing sensor histidine kinase [Aneurinibacillus thermoaerophilus]
MKDRSLKSQVRITIVLIVVSSLLATMATYAAGVVLFNFLQYKRIYPANYYESRLPDIEEYIRTQGAALLEPVARESLERVIPLEGMDYQVLDGAGERLYGSVSEPFVRQRGEWIQRLNTTFPARGKYVRAVPIVGEQGSLPGAVLLAYELKVTPADGSGRFWIAVLFVALVAAPFVYFVLAILIFTKRFAGRVNRPLQMLMEAANQIKRKNLDFELNYRADNELGRLCAAFSEMKDELKRSLFAQWKMEEERRSMIEALAHDLKTPLSLILGYTEALIYDAEAAHTGKQARYLRIIKENAETSSTLVRQMLYISDLENSGSSLNPVPVLIGSFIRQKLSHYDLQANQQRIRIETEIHGESETPVRFDAEMVERILDNVITNSLEHTPPGGRIRISVHVQPDRVSYEICNTGQCFSKKDLENLFHRFYRGEEARSGKGGHAGLGLYIVQQLTAKLGGTVKAYNSESGEACIAFHHAITSD